MISGRYAALFPGPANSGSYVHESAIPDESAWSLWIVTTRTFTGNNTLNCSCVFLCARTIKKQFPITVLSNIAMTRHRNRSNISLEHMPIYCFSRLMGLSHTGIWKDMTRMFSQISRVNILPGMIIKNTSLFTKLLHWWAR